MTARGLPETCRLNTKIYSLESAAQGDSLPAFATYQLGDLEIESPLDSETQFPHF